MCSSQLARIFFDLFLVQENSVLLNGNYPFVLLHLIQVNNNNPNGNLREQEVYSLLAPEMWD